VSTKSGGYGTRKKRGSERGSDGFKGGELKVVERGFERQGGIKRWGMGNLTGAEQKPNSSP